MIITHDASPPPVRPWLTCIQPNLSKCNCDWSWMTPGQWLVLALPWRRGFTQQSTPQTLWPEPAIWQLPCLKASITRLWSVAAARKAKMHDSGLCSWIYTGCHMWKRPEKARQEQQQSRDRLRERKAEKTKMFDRARSNYWTPFAVLSLQINIFMSVWNYPWTSIATQHNEAHKAHSEWTEKLRIKRQLFHTIQFWG